MTNYMRIPHWHPTPLNRLMRMHWAERARINTSEIALISAYADIAAVPRKCKTRQRVQMTIFLKPRQRACDPDAQLKNVLDALKRYGAIVDDSRTWLDLAPVQYERGSKDAWGTLIEIQRV